MPSDARLLVPGALVPGALVPGALVPGVLVPGPLEAQARPFKRLGVAFGVRFFVVLAIGLIWLGPALFETRFLYALVAWDILVAGAWLLDLWIVPAPGQLRVRRSWLTPPALSVQSHVRLTLFNESALTIRAGILDN